MEYQGASRLRVRGRAPVMTTTLHVGFVGNPLQGKQIEARTLPRDGESIMAVLRDEQRASWPSV